MGAVSGSAQAVIEAARALVGAPFRHQGRDARTGLDCIGFLSVATLDAGLDIPALCGVTLPADYPRVPTQPFARLIAEIERHSTRLAQPLPGALLVFKVRPRLPPHHLGVYTERDTIIHCDQRGVHEVGYRALWLKWTHSIWKMPGVNYD